METYALKVIANIGQEFKSLGIHPTTDGMKARCIDKSDGQVYEVTVKPLGITLSLDAIEAMKKGHEVKCECCETMLTDAEIIEGTGYCQYCYLQTVAEGKDEQKHPDDKSGDMFFRGGE